MNTICNSVALLIMHQRTQSHHDLKNINPGVPSSDSHAHEGCAEPASDDAETTRNTSPSPPPPASSAVSTSTQPSGLRNLPTFIPAFSHQHLEQITYLHIFQHRPNRPDLLAANYRGDDTQWIVTLFSQIPKLLPDQEWRARIYCGTDAHTGESFAFLGDGLLGAHLRAPTVKEQLGY